MLALAQPIGLLVEAEFFFSTAAMIELHGMKNYSVLEDIWCAIGWKSPERFKVELQSRLHPDQARWYEKPQLKRKFSLCLHPPEICKSILGIEKNGYNLPFPDDERESRWFYDGVLEVERGASDFYELKSNMPSVIHFEML